MVAHVGGVGGANASLLPFPAQEPRSKEEFFCEGG